MATRGKNDTTTSADSGGKAPGARAASRLPAKSAAGAPRTTGADYEGARQLLSRYCALIDQGELEALSELFHPDGTLAVSFDDMTQHRGRAAIVGWYGGFFRGWPRVRHGRHKIFEPLLEVRGNTATASTYFDSDFVEADDTVTVLAGRYDDVLVRVRGRWMFQDRRITISYHFSPGKGHDGMKRLAKTAGRSG